MEIREKMILNHPFFSDKKQLAVQILRFEKEGKGYLPNAPKTAIIPPGAIRFGEKRVTLGRIDKYYFFGAEFQDGWKYIAFEDDGKCIQFFSGIPGIDEKTLSFWRYQIRRLAEKF